MSSVLRFGSIVTMRVPGSFCARHASPLLKNSVWLRTITSSPPATSTTPNPATGGQIIPNEDFWDKNKRLNRPVSPHLTIYKPQLTSMLSITHRGTGVALSLLLSGFSIGMLCLPASYPYYLGLLAQSLHGSSIIVAGKFLMAFPFTFHLLNGIRHLTWDLGYGFNLRSLYKSGYAVLGLAIVSAAALAAY